MARPYDTDGGNSDPDAPAPKRPQDAAGMPEGGYPQSPYSLVYGGGGQGAMTGKYGNNFVNMQAYLGANRGNRSSGMDNNPGDAQVYGGEYAGRAGMQYTPGMGAMDAAMAPFYRHDQDRSPGSGNGPGEQQPAMGGHVPEAGRPAGPVYDPGPGAGGMAPPPGMPGTGPIEDPTHTGAQALRQGFQPPDFSGGGNFAGMNQQMPRKQPQAGGGY